MIAEIGRRDELHLRVIGGDQFGVLTNPADEHTREQEVGKHHDAAKAEFDDVAQAGLHQWEGDAGVDGFSPAEAEPFHQHPRHLGDIRIGVRIRRSTTHHHQQGLIQRHIAG